MIISEPGTSISYKIAFAPGEYSDQPARGSESSQGTQGSQGTKESPSGQQRL